MISKIKSVFQHYQLPMIAGILIGTSFIPFPPWASLFGLIPLWLYWLNSNSYKKIFVAGWIAQFILTLIGFNWVAYTLNQFGHLPMPFAVLGMLLFCAIAHLYFPIAGVIWLWLCSKAKVKSVVFKILLLPILLWLPETYMWSLFPWNFGYTWYWAKVPFFQTADIWGFQGISFFTLLINAILLIGYKYPLQRKPIWISAALLFMALNILGFYQKTKYNSFVANSEQKQMNLSIIQANIGNLAKIAAEKGWGFRGEIVSEYLELSKEAHEKSNTAIDYMLWPETAFPVDMGNPNDVLVQRVIRYFKERDIGLITGSYSIEPKTQLTTNSLFIIESDGEIAPDPYHKTHLLAFGEFFPGDSLYPNIYKLLPQVAHFFRGTGPSVKILKNGLLLGPQICYESLFPNFSRELSNLGAHFIVNLTNDSWYGSWQEPFQHLHMTLGRAVEFRTPLVRSTNTGISTVVLANGDTLKQSPTYKKWWHTYQLDIPIQKYHTVYAKMPYIIQSFCLIFLIALIGLSHVKKP